MLIALYATNMEEKRTCITVMPPKEGLSQYRYAIPRGDLARASAIFFCPLLFSALSLDSFYDLLCNVYLERCIIFVSENLNVLTSSMYVSDVHCEIDWERVPCCTRSSGRTCLFQ